MLSIFVDADACPVREETVRVAERHGIPTFFVSDGGIRPHISPLVELIVVDQGIDAADKWIVKKVTMHDIVVTSDIRLASSCIDVGGVVIKPDGGILTHENIAPILATRNLMSSLRESGNILSGSGPFTSLDRSHFLSSLEVLVQKSLRGIDA